MRKHDLEDFAVGFTLHEGIIASLSDIASLDVVKHGDGIELRMWLGEARAGQLSERRRHMAGPTGCGLCRLESLSEAVRPVPSVEDSGVSVSPGGIMQALVRVPALQDLNRLTRAMHAAA